MAKARSTKQRGRGISSWASMAACAKACGEELQPAKDGWGWGGEWRGGWERKLDGWPGYPGLYIPCWRVWTLAWDLQVLAFLGTHTLLRIYGKQCGLSSEKCTSRSILKFCRQFLGVYSALWVNDYWASGLKPIGNGESRKGFFKWKSKLKCRKVTCLWKDDTGWVQETGRRNIRQSVI